MKTTDDDGSGEHRFGTRSLCVLRERAGTPVVAKQPAAHPCTFPFAFLPPFEPTPEIRSKRRRLCVRTRAPASATSTPCANATAVRGRVSATTTVWAS